VNVPAGVVLDGIVVLDKPAGVTSQAAVSRCRRALGVRKAGHAGTLDPMATGVLIVGLGKATRLLGYLAEHDKTYCATIRLGCATTTDDAEGEPLGDAVDATGIADEAILARMAAYRGPIEQRPSSVSAIKVDGKRAYALARAGAAVDLPARPVTIHRYDLLGRTDDAPYCDLDVAVECSSGTYIRALARDLGADLGVGGHITALRRVRSGGFGADEAVGLDAIGPADVLGLADAARRIFPCVTVDAAAAVDAAFGRALPLRLESGPTAVLDPAGRLLGLYALDPSQAGWARPLAVLV